MFTNQDRIDAYKSGNWELETDSLLALGLVGFWPLNQETFYLDSSGNDNQLDKSLYKRDVNCGTASNGTLSHDFHPTFGAIGCTQWATTYGYDTSGVTFDMAAAYTIVLDYNRNNETSSPIAVIGGTNALRTNANNPSRLWSEHGTGLLAPTGTELQNQMYQIGVTHDGSGGVALYKDGIQIASTTGLTETASGTLRIGRFNGGFSDDNCLFANFRIYNRELSEAEMWTSFIEPEQLIRPTSRTVYELPTPPAGFNPFWAHQTRIQPPIGAGVVA